MNFVPTFSPAPLSYMAALKGIVPRRVGTAFTYGLVNCQAPDYLVALAASNPEGRFYGLMTDASACADAGEEANARGVHNVSFLCATPAEALGWIEKGKEILPPLDYLCCDESETPFTSSGRAALFDLAAKSVRPNGIFAINYRACADEDGTLRFLVREFAPEMTSTQACSLLLDLKKLGGFYFKRNAALAARLDQAIVRNMPDEFFDQFDQGEARSVTFDTVVALRPRGFLYAGDSSISASYIELSVPFEAQQTIIECKDNPLYEPIKDFAQNRTVRSDVWCQQPVTMSTDPTKLFSGFVFGITMPRDKVPTEIEVQGKTIALDTPFYAKLIDIMTLIPVGIGDALAHPDGKDFTATEVVGAMQILVACGIARPMRGIHQLDDVASIAQPRLVGSYNQFIYNTSLSGNAMQLASPVLGDAMTISPRDALVMQALDRAGLANSVSALLPELQRLARNPSQAARVMNAEPTPETARQMIEDAVSESIVQWYAYGLLKAA